MLIGSRSVGHQSASSRTRGFTLIELLVVVAVIALLIAILLPTLGAARETGRRARCLSNLHQIAVAWNMYLDYESASVFPRNLGNIQWFYGGKVQTATNLPVAKIRPVNRYLGHDPRDNAVAEIFHCPSDRGFRYMGGPEEWEQPSTYDFYGNSYPANGRLFATPLLRFPAIRRVDVRLPPAIVVMVGDQQHFSPGGLNIRAPWHDSDFLKMNIGFMDGHAAFVKFQLGVAQTSYYSHELDWLDPNDPNEP